MSIAKLNATLGSSSVHIDSKRLYLWPIHGARTIAFTAMLSCLIACSAQTAAVPTTAPTTSVSNHGAKANNSNDDTLMYVSQTASNPEGQIFVLSYPRLKLVQTISGLGAPPVYMCSDSKGDVFVTATDFSSAGYVYEFAHGGTQPIETLTDPGPGYAQSCSVDPTTGNLAVANGPNVAVYGSGQSVPIIYDASDIGAADCAYDDSGDLFVDDSSQKNGIAELPSGGTNFLDINLNKSIGTSHLQWWDNQLVVYAETAPKSPFEMVQIQITGSSGTVSAPIYLDSKTKHRGAAWEFALWGKTIAFARGAEPIYLWHYPKGGRPYKSQKPKGENAYYGIAISQ